MPIVVSEQELGPMKRPWQFGVAVGRAYELLRADVQSHLRLCREKIGCRYCRFHGLLHDDMLVALRDPEGKLYFQWKQVDKVFDFLLSIGMKPFVELGPMPSALSSGPTTFFWWRMNVTPPRDWGEWEALIEDFARHCVRRYGIDEVRSWYFEVWNEPNLRAFWTGTWEEYIELYARAATALKRVDSDLRIGGPASAEAKKVTEFLADCKRRDSPVDFVSTHVYPQNEWNHFPEGSPHRPGEFFGKTLARVWQETAGIPLFWTEYNALSARTPDAVEWTYNPSIDALPTAAWIVRQAFETDGLSEGMFWWVASDVFEEAGIAQSPFSCTYGLVTIDGIPKASFRAFEMLAKLTGTPLVVGLERGWPEGTGAVAFRDGEIVRLLAWNDASVADPHPWMESVSVSSASPCLVSRFWIRAGHGSAFETWGAMGRPQELTPLQTEALMTASHPLSRVTTVDPDSGSICIPFELEPGEIELIEVAPLAEPAHGRNYYSEEVAGWNAALGEVGAS